MDSTDCQGFGSQVVEARVKFTSRVPKAPSGLPFSVLGAGIHDTPGQMRMNLRFYLPRGGSLTSASLDGEALGTTTRMHKGHPVATVPVTVDPGGSQEVRIVFHTAESQGHTIAVRMTPGVRPGNHATVQPSACAP